MGFLANNGDIIVDAVLTDVGRQRLAMGGKNFQVSKFCLGDEEIDYSLYDSTNASGSAYYDIDILQTPVFEPATLAAGSMSSKLFTYSDQNLLYLPVLLLNQDTHVKDGVPCVLDSDTNAFDLIASDNFATLIGGQVGTSNSLIDGRLGLPANNTSFLTSGPVSAASLVQRFLRVSQGLDNYDARVSLGRLEETSFTIFVNRLFLQVADKNMQKTVQPAISTNVFNRAQATDAYIVGTGYSGIIDPLFKTSGFFGSVGEYNNGTNTVLATSIRASSKDQVGKELQFSLKISDFLASNPSFYFSTYGASFSGTVAGASVSSGDAVSMISTTVRVLGNTYGFSVDIPVKLFYK